MDFETLSAFAAVALTGLALLFITRANHAAALKEFEKAQAEGTLEPDNEERDTALELFEAEAETCLAYHLELEESEGREAEVISPVLAFLLEKRSDEALAAGATREQIEAHLRFTAEDLLVEFERDIPWTGDLVEFLAAWTGRLGKEKADAEVARIQAWYEER